MVIYLSPRPLNDFGKHMSFQDMEVYFYFAGSSIPRQNFLKTASNRFVICFGKKVVTMAQLGIALATVLMRTILATCERICAFHPYSLA